MLEIDNNYLRRTLKKIPEGIINTKNELGGYGV
jgi:hypothetical protein